MTHTSITTSAFAAALFLATSVGSSASACTIEKDGYCGVQQPTGTEFQLAGWLEYTEELIRRAQSGNSTTRGDVVAGVRG